MWQRWMQSLRQFSWRQWVAGGLLVIVGVGIGLWWGNQRADYLGNTGYQLRDQEAGYKYISPLLAYISPDKSLFKEYQALENKLQQSIDKAINEKKVANVSVYFRDLQTGHWTGVNENDEFAPASLLKVPIMIILFKQAETYPNLLNKKIYYRHISQEPITEYTSSTTTQLKFDQYYTVNKLIEAMIIDSDNDAKALLIDLVDSKIMAKLFNELEMDAALEQWAKGENYKVSARQYSLLFRILYNVTFLNKDMSERALSLLSQSSFHEGLTAQLPKLVKVAHKFGIYLGQVGIANDELHDCGIVYAPDHPYFACVMTRGGSFSDLSSTISDLSLIMYKYVIAQ